MVIEALCEIGDPNGSDVDAICHYIEVVHLHKFSYLVSLFASSYFYFF